MKLFSIVAALLVTGTLARADVLYRVDSGPATERFNNSAGTENEDNWVANAFVVIDGGTELVSIEYPMGTSFIDQPVTAVIYQGVDIPTLRLAAASCESRPRTRPLPVT